MDHAFLNKYSVLIGSYARNKYRDTSDYDIVRIGHQKNISATTLPRSDIHVSYIDYSFDSFRSLYFSGSLFFHHIFSEGVLLGGDATLWEALKKRFIVSDSFEDEISANIDVLHFLNDNELYFTFTFVYLSGIYRVLKNIAIFSLAENSSYVYDKFIAIKMFWPFLSERQVELLVHINDVFERDCTCAPCVNDEAKKLAMFLRKELVHFRKGSK